MRNAACALMLSLILCVQVPAAGTYISDPKSPELLELAKPMVIDESKYGCGPMLKPGRTYYVSLTGDDKSDGLSWKSAWRDLNFASLKLKAGDTLLIGEGEYEGGFMAFNCDKGKRAWTAEKNRGETIAQVGEPGRPIRIMAAPRQRVVIVGSGKVGPLRRTPGRERVYEAALEPPSEPSDPLAKPSNPCVWEARSAIMLQDAGSMDRLEETPGTFFINAEE
ncbi:MAG: hypothetical protein ABIK85_03565, partial [Candidatus Eisenbacteria bacterium]